MALGFCAVQSVHQNDGKCEECALEYCEKLFDLLKAELVGNCESVYCLPWTVNREKRLTEIERVT